MRSQTRPLVSIIIPFWNTENYLQDAIDSVKGQTYSHWELLLVDDGSTDSSSEIARLCARQNPQDVRVLQHELHQNQGVSASRNLGLSQAVGDYICFLDADDVFLPHKLERELAIFEREPEAVVVCGAFQYWYSWTGNHRDARRDFIVKLGVKSERLYEPPALLIHNLRAGGRKPGTSSIMFRRNRVLLDICENSFVGLGDDQVFWTRLSLLAPIFVTDECLFKYRQHPDSLCATAMRSGDDLGGWQRFLDWLERYLIQQNVTDPQIWDALRQSQESIAYQIRFAPIKLFLRRVLPIRCRYWLRDRRISLQSRRSRLWPTGHAKTVVAAKIQDLTDTLE
jgi:glycosyltransferase involved in cell wall biosynthesis